MLSKNINKHLNDMKFYIFEQATLNTIEKRIEKCIKELNTIQSENEKITKYRYGLNNNFGKSDDFIIEFYYDRWEYKNNPYYGSDYNPPLKLDTCFSIFGFTEKQKHFVCKYFGDEELDTYKTMLTHIYDIRSIYGKEFDKFRNKYNYKGIWKSEN
jgi:hypothetical protein